MIKKIFLLAMSLLLCICLASCNDSKEVSVKKPEYPSGYSEGAPALDYFHRIFYEYEDGVLKNNIIRVGFARRIGFETYRTNGKGELIPIIDNIKISLQVDSFIENTTAVIYSYEISLEEFASDEYAVNEYYPELKDFKKTYDFSITELIDNEDIEVNEGICVMITYDWYGMAAVAYSIDQVNLYGKTVDGNFALDSVWETIHLPNSVM